MSDLGNALFQREIAATVIKLCAVTGLSFLAMTYLLKKIDPTNNRQKESAKLKVSSVYLRFIYPLMCLASPWPMPELYIQVSVKMM